MSIVTAARLFNISTIWVGFRKYLSHQTTISLVHATITCKLHYCNSLLYGLPTIHINKLQQVQNAAARLVTNTPRACHITPVLMDLHWLPIKHRIEFKIVNLVPRVLFPGFGDGAGKGPRIRWSHHHQTPRI